MRRELIWRRSPWDHFVHAFHALGEVASEAICTHSARTSGLAEPEEGAKKCQACMLLHGAELAGSATVSMWRMNE